MPPSGHSSSHHSSRSHSSHSSSRRSSSSRSSHSSSHHSSSSSRSSSNYSSLFSKPRSSSRSRTPVRKTRTSQPYGWNASEHGKIGHYHCSTHDYDYYPKSWTAEDGQHFEESYYDENGKHYNNMIMEGGTTMLICTYCDNRMVYTWADGSLPTCDKCGAQLQIDITDKMEDVATEHSSARGGSRRRGPLGVKIFFTVVVIWLVLKLAYVELERRLMPILNDNSVRTEYSTNSPTGSQNSIYVKEIGRTCYKDGSDWYDSNTKCWFWYNNEKEPYQWQYWYEGISSDYGDYGWMEYDKDEDAWYVEASEGNWVHLPDSYDTSKLWHMTDEFVNEYK